MDTVQFTQVELDEMVNKAIDKYRQKHNLTEDVAWGDLRSRIANSIKQHYAGQAPQPGSQGNKTLGGYVKDDFGNDKGFGLKKFGRQANRAVKAAAGVMATPAIIGAEKAGEAVRGVKNAANSAKGLLKRFIGEDAEQPQGTQEVLNFEVPKEYTHFAVRKSDNKIVNGWDYSGYDREELTRYKKDYFIVDLEDMGLDTSLFKICTVRSYQGDPFDCKNWSNTNANDCK